MTSDTKLSKLLLERGLTQTDLFDLIDISKYKTIGKDRINRIMTGKHTNYNLDTLRSFCHVLNVTPNDVIDKFQ